MATVVVEGDPARQIFDSLDTQRRGYLIKEDIASALAKMGGDEAKVTEIVSAMNADADGHILFVEFEKCFSSLFVEDEPPQPSHDAAAAAATPASPFPAVTVTAPATPAATATAVPPSTSLTLVTSPAANATSTPTVGKGQSLGLAARLALNSAAAGTGTGSSGGGGLSLSGAGRGLSKGSGLGLSKPGGSGLGSGSLAGASFRHTLHLNPSALAGGARGAEGILNDSTFDAVHASNNSTASPSIHPGLGIRPKSITGGGSGSVPRPDGPPRSPSLTITLQQPAASPTGTGVSLPLPSPSAFVSSSSTNAASPQQFSTPTGASPAAGSGSQPRASSLRPGGGQHISLLQYQQNLKQQQAAAQAKSPSPTAGPVLSATGTRHGRTTSVGSGGSGGAPPHPFGTRTTGSGINIGLAASGSGHSGTHLSLPTNRKRSERSRGSLMEILEAKQLATLSAAVAADEKKPATPADASATGAAPAAGTIRPPHSRTGSVTSVSGDAAEPKSPHPDAAGAEEDSRMAKLMKLAAWCDSDLTEGQITITELETTAQYLCRAPNEKETDQIVAAFSRHNVECITCESFRSVLQDCIEYEKTLPPSRRSASPSPASAVVPPATTAAVEAEREKFASVYITSLVAHVRPIRTATPTPDEVAAAAAQRLDADTEFDEAALSASFALIDDANFAAIGGDGAAGMAASDLANLKQHIRHLTTVARRATDQFALAKSHALELEAENESIRNVYTDLQTELSARAAESREYKDGLEAHKQLLDRVEEQQKELVAAVRQLKEERENLNAQMAIERKIKASLETELAHTRDTMNALQANASELKRNALKEKLATTKNIMGARSQWAAIKDANSKIPILESENKELKALVARLESEALEHNRLLNSLRFSHGAHSPSHSIANLTADARTPGGRSGRAFDFAAPLTPSAARNRGVSLEAQMMESMNDTPSLAAAVAAIAPLPATTATSPSATAASTGAAAAAATPPNAQSYAIDLAAHAAEVSRLEKRIAGLQSEAKEYANNLKVLHERALRGADEKHELSTQLETANTTLASVQKEIESLKAKLAAELLTRAELERRLAACTCAQNAARRAEEEMRHASERAQLKAEADKRASEDRARRATEEQERKEHDRLHEMEILKLRAELSAAKLAAHAAERKLAQQPSPAAAAGANGTPIFDRRPSLLTKTAALLSTPTPAAVVPQPAVVVATPQPASRSPKLTSQSPPKLIEPAVTPAPVATAAPVDTVSALPPPASASATAAASALEKRRESFDAMRKSVSVGSDDAKSKFLSSLAAAQDKKWNLNAAQQQELAALSRVMNTTLGDDTDLTSAVGGGVPILPIEPISSELLTKVRDGLLLAKFINVAAPATIDERVLNKRSALTPGASGSASSSGSGTSGAPLNSTEIVENLNLVISAAKSIGVIMRAVPAEAPAPQPSAATAAAATASSAVSIISKQATRPSLLGSSPPISGGNTAAGGGGAGLDTNSSHLQLMNCTAPDVVIDFVMQLVRAKYLSPLNLRASPQLGLLQPPAVSTSALNVNPLGLKSAEIDELLALSPTALLLRWMNFHLTNAVGAALSSAEKSLRIYAPKQLAANFAGDTKDGAAILLVVRHLVVLKYQTNAQLRAAAAANTLSVSAAALTPMSPLSPIAGRMSPPPGSGARSSAAAAVVLPAMPVLCDVPLKNATHAIELAASELNVTSFIDPIDIANGHANLTVLFVASLFSVAGTLGLRKRKAPGAITTSAAASSGPPVSGETPTKPLKEPGSPHGARLSIGGMPAPLLSRPSMSSPGPTRQPTVNRAPSMGRISLSVLTSASSPSTSALVPAGSSNSKEADQWEDDDDMGRVLRQLRAHDTTVDDDREERAFRNWINACGIPGVSVHNLFADLRDGLVLLRVFEHIEPGIVDWTKVEKKPSNKFKAVGNCNHALAVGRRLKYSLVGIDGSNVWEGHRTFTLALVWQMMRYHTIKYLQSLYSKRYGNRQISDAQIIVWANNRVSKAVHPFLKLLKVPAMMSSFKDANLSNSLFLLNLLSNVSPNTTATAATGAGTGAAAPAASSGGAAASAAAASSSTNGSGSSGAVNWQLVTAGTTAEDKLLNARYAISIARKLGATIFLLPEDIIEGKPKMLMTFFGSIMAFDGTN